MSRLALGAFVAFTAVGLLVVTAPRAQARSSVVVPYANTEVWPAAIRFLRVDRNYRVKEKDQPSGYVLFELPENKRTYRAAIEMVKAIDDEGRTATQITCTINDLPRRYEATLLDQLSAKVRDERGPPAPPPKPPAASEAPPPENKPNNKPRDKADDRADDKAEPRPDDGDLGQLPKPPTWGPAPR